MTEHTTTRNTSIDNLIQFLLKEGYENGLPRIAEMILNAAMFFERSAHLDAPPMSAASTETVAATDSRTEPSKALLVR
jgi:hypothetical protein